jgi:2-C-methyl-D-erythritol 4-phosphate cytidylyltransferase
MTKTTDTIKEVDENGRIIKTIERTKLYNTQTPQAFRTDLILKAHNELKNGNYTDDASMLEELNIPVYIVNGNYTNIKITNKSDLDFAKLYI